MDFTDFPSSDIDSIFLSLHAAWAGDGKALNAAQNMNAESAARYRVITCVSGLLMRVGGNTPPA
ncbi:hypothetical protein J2732_000738 [Achromobacter deleyi]|uniref:hypothetical protein n=1 Tax=Achromobacter TaxID=222 RepID=UPI001E5BA265|nr:MULTISPECIES: hypothetical protein [Achromobacter]MDR6599755.1 hypothetical protein [Achromobacter deleyi]